MFSNNVFIKTGKTVSLLTVMLWLVVGCGGDSQEKVESKIEQVTVSSGALPDVSAEMGGAGFTGEGWMSNEDYESDGDPRAKKGGSLTWSILEFPATLRTIGKDSNSYFNRMVETMLYESLLGVSSKDLSFVPSVATHWKISEDKRTYWYRINPEARFSDGSRITAEDVIATWKLQIDPGILAPYTNLLWEKFDTPTAESPYIVKVHTKELNWKFFLYFGGMSIMPAKYIGNITGAEYMTEYQFKMIPGSGPYEIDEQNIHKGRSITIIRRGDYWDEDNPKIVGTANFDRIKYVIVKDERLTFEKFKKGELDVYLVGRAQWWITETDFDNVKRGLVQKRKIYSDAPQGHGGLVFNMREAPFNDKRMRSAFTCLLNREKLMSQLFYNEYIFLDSYYPGGIYKNPDNPIYRYDPEKAIKLLAEAGYTERNEMGWLVNDKGEMLELNLTFAQPSTERIHTVYQEELKKVGIKLNLKQSTGATMFKMVNERKYKIHWQNWGGIVFPNPEHDLHSSTADPNNTNNLSGVKNDRIDELIGEYNVCFDQVRRIEIIREIDGILMEIQPYALSWYAPFDRVLYWNKFEQPDWYYTRTGDWRVIPYLWWYDEDKAKKLEEAQTDESIQLEVGETEVLYWPEYNKKHGRKYELKY